MTDEQHSKYPQRIAIQLEIVPEDIPDVDPAFVDAVGRDAIDALRNDGYTVQSVYTGRRGGILVEVIPFLTAIATDTWAQKDMVLADTSALVTILGAAIPIAKHILRAHEQRAPKDNTQKTPIKITIEIDGTPISIEAPDLESAEGAVKLAKRFQADHPGVAEKVTSQSKVRVKGHVPKNQPRRRR